MKEIIGKCPLCGGNVFENPKSYGCGNWKEKSCKFTIWKHDCHGHDFTVDEVKALLQGGEIGPLNLKSKSGKNYTASMYYNLNDKRVELKFRARRNIKDPTTPPSTNEYFPDVSTMSADEAFGFNSIPDDTFGQAHIPS